MKKHQNFLLIHHTVSPVGEQYSAETGKLAFYLMAGEDKQFFMIAIRHCCFAKNPGKKKALLPAEELELRFRS